MLITIESVAFSSHMVSHCEIGWGDGKISLSGQTLFGDHATVVLNDRDIAAIAGMIMTAHKLKQLEGTPDADTGWGEKC